MSDMEELIRSIERESGVEIIDADVKSYLDNVRHSAEAYQLRQFVETALQSEKELKREIQKIMESITHENKSLEYLVPRHKDIERCVRRFDEGIQAATAFRQEISTANDNIKDELFASMNSIESQNQFLRADEGQPEIYSKQNLERELKKSDGGSSLAELRSEIESEDVESEESTGSEGPSEEES